MLWLKRLIVVILLALSSLLTTYWSILYTRPFRGMIGNLCLKTEENPMGYCYEMLPSGGFPFTFMWDNGGVSVVGQLSWIEDEFHLLPFLANWMIYFSIFTLLYASYLYFRLRK